MMCILPEDASSDVALHIHFTLIEAFCWENDIRVVKVKLMIINSKINGTVCLSSSVIMCEKLLAF